MNKKINETIIYYQERSYSTQAERTYDLLIELIVQDDIFSQKIYTEAEMAEMLSVGRTPLRDALKLLEFDSVIKIIPRLGIQVIECKIEDFLLQTEARLALENMVSKRACKLAVDNQRDRLKELNKEFEKAAIQGDDPQIFRLDKRIHRLIDEASNNPYAVHALKPLRFFEQRVHYQLSHVFPQLGETLNNEHIAYVNAVIDKDEDASCQHLEKMIDATKDMVKARLEDNMGVAL